MQKGIKRERVNSSNIKSVGFSNNVLEVEFYNQHIYQYSPVTEEAYKEMVQDKSIGGYFAKNIRNNGLITVEQIK